MSGFWTIIEILKGFLKIFDLVRTSIAKRQAEKELKRQIEQGEGLEELKAAQTDKEIFDAEEKVSTNYP